MATLARRDTAPELALRRELHRRGLRFRVQMKVPGSNRRTIDLAFTRAKLAVYVDGCFWHGCPDHYNAPRANSEWWRWKVERNQAATGTPIVSWQTPAGRWSGSGSTSHRN